MAKKGGFKLISHRVEVKQKLGQAAMRGLHEATLDLTRRAVQNAPLDTGDLRASGSARISNKTTAECTDGKKASVRDNGVPTFAGEKVLVGEVGFSAPYALRQHEDMTLVHKDGKAKFLEDAYTENVNRYTKHIEDVMREDMK